MYANSSYSAFPDCYFWRAHYERVLLHRIFAKLACFRDEILPILAINQKTLSWVEGITKNCNGNTDFSNNPHNREKLEDSLISQNNDEILVGRTGLEPATFCTSSRCPNRARLPAPELVYFLFRYIATSSLSL